MKAWELIDAAGCRGLTRGGAQVSEKHCNFLINTGGATAADIEGLGEEVRRRVLAATGVTLEWEIKRHRRAGRAPGGRGMMIRSRDGRRCSAACCPFVDQDEKDVFAGTHGIAAPRSDVAACAGRPQ